MIIELCIKKIEIGIRLGYVTPLILKVNIFIGHKA